MLIISHMILIVLLLLCISLNEHATANCNSASQAWGQTLSNGLKTKPGIIPDLSLWPMLKG